MPNDKNEVYVYKLTLVKEYRPKDKSKYVSLLERHPRFDELYANPEHTELAMHAYREYSLSDTQDGQAFVVYCHIKEREGDELCFHSQACGITGWYTHENDPTSAGLYWTALIKKVRGTGAFRTLIDELVKTLPEEVTTLYEVTLTEAPVKSFQRAGFKVVTDPDEILRAKQAAGVVNEHTVLALPIRRQK